MIVPMSRVTLLCLARHRDEALGSLRDAGVVHLDPWQPPGGPDLDAARGTFQNARNDVELLGRVAAAKDPGVVTPEPAAVLTEYRRLRGVIDGLTREVESLRRDEAVLEPFGDFDRKGIADLASAGIRARLLRLPSSFSVTDLSAGVIEVLRRDRQAVWAVQFGAGDIPPGGSEITLPSASLSDTRIVIAAREADLANSDQRLSQLASHTPAVRSWVAELEERVDFLEAATGLAAHGEILALRGFCPDDRVPALKCLAAAQGWGMLVEEPSAEDRVPTLLRNNAAVRPAQTILNMLGILPGYREVDIGAAFLFFFSIFFAMIIGDAGYGAIFLGLTLWARRRHPTAPAQPFHLMILLSSATIIWGLLTGTVFGMSALPGFLRRLRVEWLLDESNVIRLCFLLGAVHLSFAHLWNAWINRRSTRALGQIGWMATTWTMFFGARHLILDEPFPPFAGWLFLFGLVLIVVFMTPPSEFRKEWTGHAMLPLSLVSNFVDVVSYVRLFAVGTAGLAVETSFNAMAAAQGFHGILPGLMAALILFFGHALNMVLGAMGILVHGVRLNTLEFSGHMGLTWSGVRYAPFARRTGSSSNQD